MREDSEIYSDSISRDQVGQMQLILEVLLDIRELLRVMEEKN